MEYETCGSATEDGIGKDFCRCCERLEQALSAGNGLTRSGCSLHDPLFDLAERVIRIGVKLSIVSHGFDQKHSDRTQRKVLEKRRRIHSQNGGMRFEHGRGLLRTQPRIADPRLVVTVRFEEVKELTFWDFCPGVSCSNYCGDDRGRVSAWWKYGSI